MRELELVWRHETRQLGLLLLELRLNPRLLLPEDRKLCAAVMDLLGERLVYVLDHNEVRLLLDP